MDALKNLDVWRRACRFSADVYGYLSECKNFGFRDQLGRSALSVASNIAEGYARDATKERVYFLRVAKGSCAEAWTQIYIGVEAGLIPREHGIRLTEEAKQISKMIYGLIAHFEKRP
jgi:four helix bundle protein